MLASAAPIVGKVAPPGSICTELPATAATFAVPPSCFRSSWWGAAGCFVLAICLSPRLGAGCPPILLRSPRGRLEVVRSARLRESEIDLRRRGIGPAGRYHLAARVEADPLGPVDVRVPEERRLPPAERVVGDGNRDRDVDAD